MDKITLAVSKAGGHAAVASALGVHPSLVSQWTTGRLRVAPRHCLAIERMCGGEVTAQQLRPDVFGEPGSGRNKAA
jgi:DNA-binding transcriptional regulator YdaS (Cro superfamily)